MHLRLMNDYTVSWPLWAPDGLFDDGEPQVPASLANALRDWAAVFNENYDYLRGWPTSIIAIEHQREGQRLHHELQRARPGDTITLEYWETAHSEDP